MGGFGVLGVLGARAEELGLGVVVGADREEAVFVGRLSAEGVEEVRLAAPAARGVVVLEAGLGREALAWEDGCVGRCGVPAFL